MQKTLETVNLNVLDVEVEVPLSELSAEFGSATATTESGKALEVPGATLYLDRFRKHLALGPNDKVPYEIDGVRQEIEVWQIPLVDPENPADRSRYNLLRGFALLSPAVFVSQGPDKAAKFGMLSPHLGSSDNSLLPGIKVMIPKRDIL